jgi:hypothetical protein
LGKKFLVADDGCALPGGECKAEDEEADYPQQPGVNFWMVWYFSIVGEFS